MERGRGFEQPPAIKRVPARLGAADKEFEFQRAKCY